MSHHHPGYLYRLVGRITPESEPHAITDWTRDHGACVRKFEQCLRDDRADGYADEPGYAPHCIYKIETISADWLA